MLDKLSGVFAPKPNAGPHKMRECLPVIIFLRNRLKYALNYEEAKKICQQRLIRIDNKVRTDMMFPAGFMGKYLNFLCLENQNFIFFSLFLDVISIEKTNEFFRLIYDVKGRFAVHRITKEEAKYKLCKVKKTLVGPKGVPMLITHDGRTLRYPDPHIKVNDSVRLDLASNKIEDYIKFDSGKFFFFSFTFKSV
jgi:small subunit ribosomal protein S4e